MRKCIPIKLKKLYLVFIATISIVSFIVWYSVPKEINQAFDGIVYGVGSKSNQINKEVNYN
jgi:TM2 domain-containing membrane protein YozV